MTSHLLALLLALVTVILPLRNGCTDVTGGHPVLPHSWPFMALTQKDHLTVCGGALLANKWVLTAAHYSGEDIKPGRKCKVAGWGVTSSGKPPPCLQETIVTIVDRRSCKIKCKKHMKITSNMLSAGGKNIFAKKDACEGDSGGPLICASRYSGIVCFGKGCGKRKMPGVYTRLTEKYIA